MNDIKELRRPTVPELVHSGAKIIRFKFAAAEFERWRRKQKFAIPEVANLALTISSNLRTIEKHGDSATGILRKFLLEDLNRLQRAIAGDHIT